MTQAAFGAGATAVVKGSGTAEISAVELEMQQNLARRQQREREFKLREAAAKLAAEHPELLTDGGEINEAALREVVTQQPTEPAPPPAHQPRPAYVATVEDEPEEVEYVTSVRFHGKAVFPWLTQRSSALKAEYFEGTDFTTVDFDGPWVIFWNEETGETVRFWGERVEFVKNARCPARAR